MFRYGALLGAALGLGCGVGGAGGVGCTAGVGTVTGEGCGRGKHPSGALIGGADGCGAVPVTPISTG